VFSDRAFSFDLYNGDDLVGTFNKTDLAFQQKIQVDLPIYKEEFGIKIKSNDAVARTVQVDHLFLLID
jgi:hypothetical protein